jgi:hypothetical protein
MTNPEGVTSIPLEQRIMAWAILLATIGGAGYLLFRYRSRLRGAVKFAIATFIIAVVKVARYLRAEASDIRMQVSHGLDQSDPREGQTLTTAKQDHAPGRPRLVGRMFFNLAIAPLLLGGVLIGVAVIASKMGFSE